jgi:hypothetical protein
MTLPTTANWNEFRTAAPELATAVEGRFRSHLHHVLATLRRDGSPRVSGTEVSFVGNDVWLGGMPGSRKMLDLRRDPRFALHSATLETDLVEGDARLTGRAVEITDRAEVQAVLSAGGHGEGHGDALLFRLGLTEVSLVRVRGDELWIDRWSPGQEPRLVTRR